MTDHSTSGGLSVDGVQRISASKLKSILRQPDEVALLDVREAGEFANGHPFLAVSVPLSRFEPELLRLVPRRATQVILYDDGSSARAMRAAECAAALCYRNVSILDGGIGSWQRAGYTLFEGVNVPSKSFGEVVENAYKVPQISARQLADIFDRGDEIILLDGRTLEEHSKMTIPGSICIPNGELALRVRSLIKNDQTPVIVHCAGRTRSIIGAQTLRLIGLRNPIYALENGTQGWTLAGLRLEQGSSRPFNATPPSSKLSEFQAQAKNFAKALNVRFASKEVVSEWLADDGRTTYLLDVRSPKEYEEGHAEGANNAPGGQLIQSTDLWLAVRNARVVLVDDADIRAVITANWLDQMGWNAYVLSGGRAAWSLLPSAAPGLQVWTGNVREIAPHSLARSIRDGQKFVIIDARPSMSFRKAHLAGAIWLVRHQLQRHLRNVHKNEAIVVVANDAMVRVPIIKDLIRLGYNNVCALRGQPSDWAVAGLTIEGTPKAPPDRDCIDFVFFTHDRHSGNMEAARRYLEWEIGLVARLDHDERNTFRLPVRSAN